MQQLEFPNACQYVHPYGLHLFSKCPEAVNRKGGLKMSSEVSVRSVTPSSDQMIVYFRTPE